MGSDWVSTTLGELAEIEMGQSPKGTECNSTGKGTPLLNGPTEFGSYHPYPTQFTTDPKRYSKSGDLLFCVRGSTTGRMNWSDKEYAIGRGLAAFRHRGGEEYKSFLRGVIDIKLPELLSSATGSTFPNVSKSQLHELTVTIPPLPEQKAIAHILGSLDDKIELNRQMNETLESMAQALFKSWFVDFDPVIDNALAAGNPIPDEFAERAERRQNTKQQKTEGVAPKNTSNNIQTQFPSEFEYTEEMGWIPKGWSVKNIDNLGKVITGKTPPKKIENSYSDKGTPFITPTDVDDSLFATATNRYLSDQGQSAVKKSKISSGTICVTCIGSQMGKTIIAPVNSFTNQQINSVEVKNPLYRNYLFFNLRRLKKEIFLMGSSGSTMPIINKSTFEKIQIVLPIEELLITFDKNVQELVNSVLSNQIENQTLSKLRDTLLPRLLSGELRIPDAEKLINEVKNETH